ncbi:SDR family NAD(P)-dependent oxidoreductase [Salinicoccus sp. YB14-2]|uniref:SDR family NAD(P)-dependent oxidoreductase n=1 Tax=Salinicoccus sp. YB14-2 TaxID=1572701 RepID=UPI002101B996|nr:SDR family NAD(P)-dependent oxidoreductase [Salinicoccus sp. YB14-2]
MTGAGSGLGAALARMYSAEGAYVCLLGRTRSKLEKVSQQLGNESSIYEVDVTSKQSVKRISEKWGKE